MKTPIVAMRTVRRRSPPISGDPSTEQMASLAEMSFGMQERFSQFRNIGQFAQHGGPNSLAKQGYIQGNLPFPPGVTSFLVAESEGRSAPAELEQGASRDIRRVIPRTVLFH